MEVLKSIKECFASLDEGSSRAIEGLSNKYKAYAIRIGKSYGVGIPVGDETDYIENFTKAKIETSIFNVGEENVKMLFLSSEVYGVRKEFALICSDFVDPGNDGKKRKEILANPDSWSAFWSDLLGNTKKTKKVYDVLAEMGTLLYVFNKDKSAKWTGAKSGTHDIETKNFSYEVKSTNVKYGNTVTISSQNQLEPTFPNKVVKLSFCRLEKNPYGQSIEDFIEILGNQGYDLNEMEDNLKILGFAKGRKERHDKYVFLEKKLFIIGEDFPKINFSDIKDEKTRDRLIKLVYTIDLTGLENEIFK